MNPAGTIELHQTLHGYGDGHQLLASSLELTRDQQWQMLVMSDLSGPSFHEGFDGYLTGYPLDGGGLYCIAKTWFAPELPRPGCVWTHTLLVADADLARITDLRALTEYLHRPTRKRYSEAYGAVVTATLGNATPVRTDVDTELSTVLISLLYGSPGRKVVLTAGDAHEYEDALAAVFQQQWPRLRRTFRFCTGALAIRDVEFDLAVAPSSVASQDTARTPPVTAIEMAGLRDHSEREEWIRSAVEDLRAGDSRGPFRQFLWAFGPDYVSGRAAFQPLCEVYLAARQPGAGVDEAMSALGHFFPEASSSRRLKAALLGIAGTLTGTRGEAAVLRGLVTHPAAGSIPVDVALIEERARALVETDPGRAIESGVAIAAVGNAKAAEFLRGFAAGVTAVPGVLGEMPGVLVVSLLKEEPRLLVRPAVWKEFGQRMEVVAGLIPSLPRTPDIVRGVIAAMLDARTLGAIRGGLAWSGVEGVAVVFEWIEKGSGTQLAVAPEVVAALGERRDEVVEVLSERPCGPRALMVAAALLDPRSQDVRALTRTVWVNGAGHGIVFEDTHLEIRAKACLLSLGLSSGDVGSVALVREAFSTVYEGAKQGGGIDDELWGFVEPYLPWYLVTWDRCARLVRGVVRQVLEQRWPAVEYLATFGTAEQLARALKETARTPRGRRYIRGVCAGRTERLHPDDPRWATLLEYCKSKASKVTWEE